MEREIQTKNRNKSAAFHFPVTTADCSPGFCVGGKDRERGRRSGLLTRFFTIFCFKLRSPTLFFIGWFQRETGTHCFFIPDVKHKTRLHTFVPLVWFRSFLVSLSVFLSVEVVEVEREKRKTSSSSSSFATKLLKPFFVSLFLFTRQHLHHNMRSNALSYALLVLALVAGLVKAQPSSVSLSLYFFNWRMIAWKESAARDRGSRLQTALRSKASCRRPLLF